MQGRLALFERYCRHRVCDPGDSRDRHLLKMQRLRTNQLRRCAPHGTPVPAGTRTSQHLLLAASRKSTRSQRGETANPTPTSYHSCRGSQFTNSSLLTVRISLADPFEGTYSPNPTGGIAGTERDILPILLLATY